MEMYDPLKFRTEIIKPALLIIDLYSLSAENLLLGTALKESNLIYVHQIHGPAIGYFEMEPKTYFDCFKNYLIYHEILKDNVLGLISKGDILIPSPEVLGTNNMFAAAMCRIKYERVPKPLPHPDDIEGLANYWKTYYNTGEGAGTVQEFIDLYNKYNVNTNA